MSNRLGSSQSSNIHRDWRHPKHRLELQHRNAASSPWADRLTWLSDADNPLSRLVCDAGTSYSEARAWGSIKWAGSLRLAC